MGHFTEITGSDICRKHQVFEYQNYQLSYDIRYPSPASGKEQLPLLMILQEEDSPLSALILSKGYPEIDHALLVSVRIPGDDLPVPGRNIQEYRFQEKPLPAAAALLKLTDHLLQHYPVDFERIYLAGNARGGVLCWELIRRRAGLFAAALLIGSGTDLAHLQPNPATVILLHHGIFDPIFPVNCSRELYLTLMDAHCDVKLKEIPGCEHDALEETCNDPETFQRLFNVRQRIFTSMPIPETLSPVHLDAHGFTAEILPEAGGNLFSLRHKATGRTLLREPHRTEELFHSPERFGIPILFPPNRVEGGAFFFEGRVCRLPINLPAQNLHLHGLAVSKTWILKKKDASSAELEFHFTPESPEYEGFPFACTIKRKYELTESGLRDTVSIRNNGEYNMPLGLGFHTAFPAEDVSVRLGTADHEIEIDPKTFLPTGRCLEWNSTDPRKPFTPFGKKIGFHTAQREISLEDGTILHGAELQYPEGTLKYHTDEKFSFWYTWNAGGLNDFLCLEPVSWMANALNLPIPASRAGVRKLSPGETITFVSTLEFSEK